MDGGENPFPQITGGEVKRTTEGEMKKWKVLLFFVPGMVLITGTIGGLIVLAVTQPSTKDGTTAIVCLAVIVSLALAIYGVKKWES